MKLIQPLTAIQAYARTAAAFLERGEPGCGGNAQYIAGNRQPVRQDGRARGSSNGFAAKSEGLPSQVDLPLARFDAALTIIRAGQQPWIIHRMAKTPG